MNNSHYVYNLQRTQERLIHTITEEQRGNWATPDTRQSSEFNLPPHTYKVANWLIVQTPVQGSELTKRFLGKYYQMFKDMAVERPIPSWKALEWLVEDYGQSVEEDQPYDQIYDKISKDWQVNPPTAVSTNGHFCKCERRYRWNPSATIDSVEYNGPKIPGNFLTPNQCAESYSRFFELHNTHTDPVCFRAAVFCDFLATICQQHQIIINVNRFDPNRPEFHIMLKIQHQSTRWHRVVEVMAITHFLYGPHLCWVNEFPCTRFYAWKYWFNSQRTNNPALLIRDADVRKAVDKSAAQQMNRADMHRNKKMKCN